MEEIILRAEERSGKGKSVAAKLRREGRLPAVLYGRDTEPLAISIGAKEWDKLRKHMNRNVILSMELQKAGAVDKRSVMVRDIQKQSVSHQVLHIDFLQVSMERMVEVEITIHLTGTPKGLQNNGIIEQHLRTINVECLPANIPEEIAIDISDLDIGDSYHTHQISIPGVRLLEAHDVAIVTVTPPTVEATPAAAAGEGEKKE
jgi:large subunit ribosomal protein L25